MEQEKPKHPHIIDCIPGTYAWCTCGQSKSFPHCDGSHRATEYVPHVHIVGKETKVFLCACGKSKNSPYCDGSHNNEEKK